MFLSNTCIFFIHILAAPLERSADSPKNQRCRPENHVSFPRQAIIFRIGLESSNRGGVQRVMPVIKRHDAPDALLEEACGAPAS